MQHLDPQRLQFAIATALLSLFLLMVLPVAKIIRRARMRRARRRSLPRDGAPSLELRASSLDKPRSGLRQPLLLPGEADGAGQSLLLALYALEVACWKLAVGGSQAEW